jgi:hypothetical protein
MKNRLLIIVLVSCSVFSFAQESKPKTKEVGLAFSGFNSFGFTYRVGNDKALWRFNTLAISGGNNLE